MSLSSTLLMASAGLWLSIDNARLRVTVSRLSARDEHQHLIKYIKIVKLLNKQSVLD